VVDRAARWRGAERFGLRLERWPGGTGEEAKLVPGQNELALPAEAPVIVTPTANYDDNQFVQ
jgi:hypothetical protein